MRQNYLPKFEVHSSRGCLEWSGRHVLLLVCNDTVWWGCKFNDTECKSGENIAAAYRRVGSIRKAGRTISLHGELNTAKVNV